MSRTKVRLTTELWDLSNPDATNIYPYSFYKNHQRVDVRGYSQIIIHDFHMIDPSRVEIHWFNNSETTNIFGGSRMIKYDIPDNCTHIIFSLDPFSWDDRRTKSNDRIAEFEFELV